VQCYVHIAALKTYGPKVIHEAPLLHCMSMVLAHRDLASTIHFRNGAESGQTRTDANDPQETPQAPFDFAMAVPVRS